MAADESKVSITGCRRGAAAGRTGRARGGRCAAAGPQTTDFPYSKDWTVVAGGRGAPPLEAVDVSGNLVFAGNGYVINKTKINPYEGLDVKGKIIVVAGLPAEIAAQQAAAGTRRARRTRRRRRRPMRRPRRAAMRMRRTRR